MLVEHPSKCVTGPGSADYVHLLLQYHRCQACALVVLYIWTQVTVVRPAEFEFRPWKVAAPPIPNFYVCHVVSTADDEIRNDTNDLVPMC